MSAGIDYGMGRTNIDTANGIRYGVISVHSVTQAWYDSAESDYGDPHCPKCGSTAHDSGNVDTDGIVSEAEQEAEWFTGCDYYCADCEYCFWSDEAFGDEPIGWTLSDGEYEASDCLDSDIMITRSPYYTYAPFCSPCVPGAGNLDDALRHEYGETREDGTVSCGRFEGWPKVYCFSHDWFDDGKAPYRVFRVADDTEVLPEVR